MPKPVGFNVDYIRSMDMAAEFLEKDLIVLCNNEAVLSNGYTVLYPDGFPSNWLQEGILDEKSIRIAKNRGWKVVQFSPSILSEEIVFYLLPPDEISAQLLNKNDYELIHGFGVLDNSYEKYIQDDYGNESRFDVLLWLLDAGYYYKRHDGIFSRPEDAGSDVIETLERGGLLVKVDGETYLLPSPEERMLISAELFIGNEELKYLSDLGLIALRSAQNIVADVNIHVGRKGSFVRAKEVLDIEKFVNKKRNRWGGEKIKPVVDAKEFEKSIIGNYPVLVDWLKSYITYVEPKDIEAIESMLIHLEKADSTEFQKCFLNQIKGLIGKIAFRKELLNEYQEIKEAKPGAILLLQLDFLITDGKLGASAIIGEIVNENGEYLFKAYGLYGSTIRGTEVTTLRERLEHLKNVRMKNGIHIRGESGSGYALPVDVASLDSAKISINVLDPSDVERIRKVTEEIHNEAVVKFGEKGLKVPEKGSSHIQKNVDPNWRLISGGLFSLSQTALEGLSKEYGSKLCVRGILRDGNLTALSIFTGGDLDIVRPNKGYFILVIEKTGEKWVITKADGVHIIDVLEMLKKMKNAPRVPSAEWLFSRGNSKINFTTYKTKESIEGLKKKTLDKWRGEFNKDILTVSGSIVPSLGVIYDFAIDNKKMGKQDFIVEFGFEGGKWSIMNVGGINVGMIVDTLRKTGKWLHIPSNEWLSQTAGFEKTLSKYTTIESIKNIDSKVLDKWAGEFNTKIVQISGFKFNDAIQCFEINRKERGNKFFFITFIKRHGKWWVDEISGSNAGSVFDKLREESESKKINFRSWEWLNRNAASYLSSFDSTESLKNILIKKLNEWKGEYGGNELLLSGYHDNNGNIRSFGVNRGGGDARFYIRLTFKKGEWRLSQGWGTNVKKIIDYLREIKGAINVPSNESLLRKGQMTLSDYTSIESIRGINIETLDKWAVEYKTNLIEISGFLKTGGDSGIISFGVNKQRKHSYFYVQFFKIDGLWVVTDAGSVRVQEVLDVLGQSGAYIPSYEFLCRERTESFTKFFKLGEFKTFTTELLDKWWLEFRTRVLEISGWFYSVDKDNLYGFGINKETKNNKKFLLRFGKTPLGWLMLGSGGFGAKSVLEAVNESQLGTNILNLTGGQVSNEMLLDPVILLGGSSRDDSKSFGSNLLNIKSDIVKGAYLLEKALTAVEKIEKAKVYLKNRVDKR